MKKIFTIVIFFFAFGILTFAQSANSSSSSISGKPITAKLVLLTQDVMSKSIPIELDLSSTIDARNVSVEWTYDFSSKAIKLQSQNSTFTSIVPGGTQKIVYNFLPLADFQGRIYVKVQAWQNETVYPDIAYVDLKVDKNLEMYPQTQEYMTNKNTYNLVLLIIGVFGLIAAVYIGVLLYKRFYAWYSAD